MKLTMPFHTVLYLAALIATIGQAVAEVASCPLKEVASIPVQRTDAGGFLVPATLDDHKLLLMLDTGSAMTSSLFERTVTALDLDPIPIGNYRFSDISGHPIDKYIHVKTLELGGLHLHSTQFLDWPYRDLPQSRIAGLLGPDILRQFEVEIDPAASRLNLFSQDHCAGKMVYWTLDFVHAPLVVTRFGQIILPVTLDGKQIDALVDTGTTDTLLSVLAAREIFDLATDSPGVTALDTDQTGVTSRIKRYRYPFKQLSFAGLAIMNPAIHLFADKPERPLNKDDFQTPNSAGEEKLPELILGMSILSKLRFVIAYGEQQFYSSAAGAK